MTNKAEWLQNAEYGFFYHFLNDPKNPLPPEEWNRVVESFDVEKIARQLHILNAGYMFLTIGQNSGYYCAPNAAYDKFMGWTGENSKCSRRDLLSDFADALAEYGIPLLAYTTTQGPCFDFEAVRKLKSIPPWNNNGNGGNYDAVKQFAGDDPRLREFQLMWNEIHAEWSSRWGSKVKGWWVDGSFYGEKMYLFPDEPNGDTWINALRAGNSDSIVALCAGPWYPPRRAYPGADQDFTAGEMPEVQYGLMDGPLVCDGLQYHILTYAGQDWGSPPLRFNASEMVMKTRNITDNGGAVTWDLPMTPEGLPEHAFSVIKDFVALYAKSKERMPKTHVRLTEPRIDATGTKFAGNAEFTLVKPADMEVEWAGEKFCLQGQSHYSQLLKSSGNQDLIVKAGGIRRVIPVIVKRELELRDTPSEPLALFAGNGEKIASYRFSVKEEKLFINAEIQEEEAVCGERPWSNSCMEVFLSPDGVAKAQICLTHKGSAVKVEDCYLIPVDLDFTSHKQGGVLHIQAGIPLSHTPCFEPIKRSFSFEIQQSVNRGGQALQGTLFGAGFAKVGFYGRVHF